MLVKQSTADFLTSRSSSCAPTTRLQDNNIPKSAKNAGMNDDYCPCCDNGLDHLQTLPTPVTLVRSQR